MKNLKVDTDYNSYVKSTYGDYLTNVENKLDYQSAWAFDIVGDDWSDFNTWTFKDRINRYTQEVNIEPSSDFVEYSYHKLESKFFEYTDQFQDYDSRMFTVLEAGKLNNRLHLHSLIKVDKQKKDILNNNWLHNLNSWWFGDNRGFGAYNTSEINSLGQNELCCDYITKVNSYLHKDNMKMDHKFFPKFWDTKE